MATAAAGGLRRRTLGQRARPGPRRARPAPQFRGLVPQLRCLRARERQPRAALQARRLARPLVVGGPRAKCLVRGHGGGRGGKGVTPERRALSFVVLLGVVSLFADVTYEGARSVTGPYLASLGAPVAVVGLIAGAGELLGYGLRLLSGLWADRLGEYWLITGIGYGLNLLAVPSLALTGHWPAAAGLILLERVGKGLRNPPRDAMLAHAGSRIGHGWAFALHEALDQTGAVLGPLLVAAVLYAQQAYTWAFGALVVPALLALATLARARALFPVPRELDADVLARPGEVLTLLGHARKEAALLLFTALTVFGFVHFQLVSYSYEATRVLAPSAIALVFATAMAADALGALALGRALDRLGPRLLWALPAGAILATLLLFSGRPAAIWPGAVVWGAVLGAQDTILKAVLAARVTASQRATAFGLFDTVFGIAWFLGSAAFGWLYAARPAAAVGTVVAAQLAALAVLALMARASRKATVRV
ncbi:MAG: MFS transporter [Clostridia bacterium]|nr:MFS transporter [Clostridia bacterium]